MRICILTLQVLTLDDKNSKNMKNRVDSHGASYRILETVRRQNAGGQYTGGCFFAVLSFCHVSRVLMFYLPELKS